MKVLITGGLGYLGGRLAQTLSSLGQYEIFLGSREYQESPIWLPSANIVQTQWDSPTVFDEITTGMDVIVHMAGMNAQDCSADPVAALEINGVLTGHLVQAAIHNQVKRFIYLSTAHVYASPLIGVITEECRTENNHPYAATHRVGEDEVISAYQRDDIEGVVIRLSNTFGAPAQKNTNCWMLLVNDLCRQAVLNGSVVLRTTGMQHRDFVTLTDTCNAIKHLIKLPESELGNGIFNIGGNWSPTILEMTQLVVKRICKETGYEPEITTLKNDDNQNTDKLDYRIDKLTKTGFKLVGDINKELDGLVKFCFANIVR